MIQRTMCNTPPDTVAQLHVALQSSTRSSRHNKAWQSHTRLLAHSHVPMAKTLAKANQKDRYYLIIPG